MYFSEKPSTNEDAELTTGIHTLPIVWIFNKDTWPADARAFSRPTHFLREKPWGRGWPRFCFHDALEQLKTNFHTNFCFKRVLGFVIEYAWISKLLRDAAFTWRPRELSCRLKKSITLMFMSFSKNKFTPLQQNSVTDVSVGFHPPCWSSSRWALAWRLHTNLYKFG